MRREPREQLAGAGAVFIEKPLKKLRHAVRVEPGTCEIDDRHPVGFTLRFTAVLRHPRTARDLERHLLCSARSAPQQYVHEADDGAGILRLRHLLEAMSLHHVTDLMRQ